MDTRTKIVMIRWICCAMIANLLGGSFAPAFSNASEISPNATMAIDKQALGTSHIWWYADILPFRFDKTAFLFTSLAPQMQGTKQGQPDVALHSSPLDFTIWQVSDGRASQLAVMHARNYDFSKVVPQVVTLPDDLYLFFFTRQQDVQPLAPVLRRSRGGWCWQTLDTVETQIRQSVTFIDMVQGKVFDGTGQCMTDISKIKGQLRESEQLVGLASVVQADNSVGLLGKPMKFDKERPPLPYETLYFYSTEMDRKQNVMQLTTVKEVVTADPDNPTLASRAVPGLNDVITFGKPVVDGKQVFYWYCIQQKDKPTYRVYILACFNGKQAIAIDGYIVNPPNVRYWKENTWVKEQGQLEWIYQPQIGFPVQPIVGKDAYGKIISYRPPELWQLEFIPDVDKAQQNDVPAAIPEK